MPSNPSVRVAIFSPPPAPRPRLWPGPPKLRQDHRRQRSHPHRLHRRRRHGLGPSGGHQSSEGARQRRGRGRGRLLADPCRAGGSRVGAPQVDAGLSQAARHQGDRLRHDRHARALAQPHDDRRARCRQGGVLRKADDAHHSPGPGGDEEAKGDRPGRAGRRAGDVGRQLLVGRQGDRRGRAGPGRAGADRIRPPLRQAGAVARSRHLATARRSRPISIGTPGWARPPKSPGTRTTISNGAATRPIPAASAPICSSIASRGS